MTKEENYEIMQKALHSCTEEGTERVAVVVMIDTATQDVKVYGLNIDGEHIPQMNTVLVYYIFSTTLGNLLWKSRMER